MLCALKATPAEYSAGLDYAIAKGWLVPARERSVTQAGADPFACFPRPEPPDRAGDDGEPPARARHDPLARLGLPGVLLLQEFHAARLLPRPRCRLRRIGHRDSTESNEAGHYANFGLPSAGIFIPKAFRILGPLNHSGLRRFARATSLIWT